MSLLSTAGVVRPSAPFASLRQGPLLSREEGLGRHPRNEESTRLDGGARVRVAGRKHLLHQAFCLRDGWLMKGPMEIAGKLPEPWFLLLNST